MSKIDLHEMHNNHAPLVFSIFIQKNVLVKEVKNLIQLRGNRNRATLEIWCQSIIVHSERVTQLFHAQSMCIMKFN